MFNEIQRRDENEEKWVVTDANPFSISKKCMLDLNRDFDHLGT